LTRHWRLARSVTPLALLLFVSCDAKPEAPASTATATAPREAPATVAAPPRLEIRGLSFVRGESPFEWRGITAFRLVEQVAHGREAEAIAYIDWARAQKLTVVRVLVMAKRLFELSPEDGLKALPRLLQLAADRSLVVEVVALADTADIEIDLAQHVKAAAATAAAHPNAVLEIANEPWHPTQDRRLHDPAFVKGLADLVPPSVPVALGAIERGDGYAAGGTYATWHAPRSNASDGWGHVVEIGEGGALLAKWRKPLVSDEPIGAAEAHVPGRRDNEPRRFAAAAALTRLAGLGATFHYDAGLQARIPSGRELECFNAWNAALTALGGLPEGGRFARDTTGVAAVGGARAVFGRHYDQQVWIAAIDPGELKVGWEPPWHEIGRQVLPGVVVLRASRLPR
jgi:hypothetical protein